jgi:DNA-binding LacI/PurR family transcriptional regulator
VIVPHLETLAALAELPIGVPVVAVGPTGNDSVGGVKVDQRRGAELAVEHLIGQGHVRIGHVAGPQDWIDAVARAEGWRGALDSAGLEADLIIEGDWSAGSGYEIGRRLAAGRSATALFVGNDQMALGVLRALNEAGIKVPGDVSVVGFDDQPEAGYFSPPLTVVRQDFEELGRRCMDMMLTAFDGTGGPRTLVVEPELVLRSSTAPPVR